MTLDVDIVKMATDKAILVVLSGSGREVWIPRSVINDDLSDIQSDASMNDTGQLEIYDSYARKEGLDK